MMNTLMVVINFLSFQFIIQHNNYKLHIIKNMEENLF